MENKEKKKRRFGDRSEGRKLRTLPPIARISPYIMKRRSGAMNYLRDSTEIDSLEKFVLKKRNDGKKGFGILYVFIAAYIRMLAQYPAINRFVSGQKIFARNDIEVVITMKKQMKLDAPDTTIKIDFSPYATVDEVYEKFSREFEKNRTESDVSEFDNTARVLNYIPGLLLKFAVFFLQCMDYFGLIPKSLIKVSPFHGSMFITSMGSLGIPPIYHHLYDFGNIPAFLAFGVKRSQVELNRDGSAVSKKYIDFTFVTDERICDGHMFASGLKVFKEYLKNPEKLDSPPKQVNEDID